MGLKVPGLELIVFLKIFRGLLYVAVLFSIVASLNDNHKSKSPLSGSSRLLFPAGRIVAA